MTITEAPRFVQIAATSVPAGRDDWGGHRLYGLDDDGRVWYASVIRRSTTIVPTPVWRRVPWSTET